MNHLNGVVPKKDRAACPWNNCYERTDECRDGNVCACMAIELPERVKITAVYKNRVDSVLTSEELVQGVKDVTRDYAGLTPRNVIRAYIKGDALSDLLFGKDFNIPSPEDVARNNRSGIRSRNRDEDGRLV